MICLYLVLMVITDCAAAGLALSCKIYRDAKRWKTRTHTKAVIKEGERLHHLSLQKQQAGALEPAARAHLRVVSPHGSRELLEVDLLPTAASSSHH